jgi:hypothetical protein
MRNAARRSELESRLTSAQQVFDQLMHQRGVARRRLHFARVLNAGMAASRPAAQAMRAARA